MFCVKCGKQLSEAEAFCTACGAPVDGTQRPAEHLEEADDRTEIYREPVESAPVEPVELVETEEPVEPEEVHASQSAKPKKIKYQKERPHIGLRAVMQMLSFVLCLLLVVGLLASVVVLDLRRVTSAEGLEKLINAVFSGVGAGTAQNAPAQIPAAPQAANGPAVIPLSGYDFEVDDIPQDILTGGDSQENMDSLMDWIYASIQEEMTEELPFTPEELQSFIAESNVSDFLSEKLAGFAEDFVQGTEKTTITSDELMQLLEENEQLLEEKLNVKLTEEQRETLRKELVEAVDEQNLSGTIRDSVNEAMDDALQESLGMDVDTAREMIRQVTSNRTLLTLLGICLLLIALLCGLNFYNLGAGFTWSSAAGMLVGWVVCLPLWAMDAVWNVLVEMAPEMAGMVGSVEAFVAPIAPIHYGLFYGSVTVFILSVVWRIAARVINSSRPVA